MNAEVASRINELPAQLARIVGPDNVVVDEEELRFYSADVYSEGVRAALAITPDDTSALASAIGAATSAGFAVVARGGGMSYTSGYTPARENTMVVDTRRLNRILEVNAEDMYITVEAGVTWKQIYDELRPKGLRLPFFGTFSGIRATVGGGMSNGALFMATARYGTGAEIVLGLEVVLADGSTVTTGQAAFRNGRPFYRTYGPDLTGLFIHDAGALGIKTKISMRLVRTPASTDYASFVFSGIDQTAQALSELARSDVAEEAYVFDPESTKKNLETTNLGRDLRTLLGVVKGQSSLAKGLREGAKLVAAGRDFMPDDLFSLHVVCAGRSDAAVADDLAACRAIAERSSGAEIVNSIPKAVRAVPFEPLNGILGPKGDRWAALNAKVGHSDAQRIIDATDKILHEYRDEMEANGVTLTRLLIAISNHAFSFEPVFHWFDEWLPVHRRTPEPSHLKKLEEPEPNPRARELVHEIRGRIVALFAELGAASNQIGKTYPYLESLNPETAALVRGLKSQLDPQGLMNPRALGF
jgi:FAD/FMN-containing dehydrogenase